MGTVLAEMSMSLDWYLAGLDDRVGALHGWYLNGGVETPSAMEGFAFRTSPASAQVLRDALADIGRSSPAGATSRTAGGTDP